VAQLECQIGGEWIPVRRYDCSHGFLHVHPRPWQPERDRQDQVPVLSLNDGLTHALGDLVDHYEKYRARAERAILEGR
jgi:hypothetical protein